MRIICLTYTLLTCLIAGPAFADDGSKWRVGGGVQFERQSSVSGNILDGYRFSEKNLDHHIYRGTISAEYRPNGRVGIGADIGLPATLTVKGDLNNRVWDYKTSHITIMGRYYPRFFRHIKPFTGIGVTYYIHNKEKFYGEFSKADLDIKNDLSPTIAAGFEFPATRREIFRTELSYSRSRGKIIANDRDIGKISHNPVKLNFTYLTRF